MPSLKVFLFGQFEVYMDGHAITGQLWQSRQVRQIFKLLIAMRGRPVSSDQIIEILWPDADPETAQRNLYVRISQLRKLLQQEKGQELIHKVDGGYRFAADKQADSTRYDCWIDSDEFERAAGQGRAYLEEKQVKQAIQSLDYAQSLYRGEYLAEDLYQEWTVGERERLRDRFLIVLIELSEAYALNGLYRRAINLCQRILSIEPCREAVFVRLMLYYYYAGEKAKALEVYAQCAQVLHEELGVNPDQNTVKVAAQIEEGSLWQQRDLPHYPPPAFEGRMFEVPYSLGKTPFSGRAREYAWLINQWREHPQSVLWIEGEAGVGKTRLKDEFVGYAASQGAQVIKLRGLPHPQLPYAAWIQAIREYPDVLNPDGLNDRTRMVLQAFLSNSDTFANVERLVDDPSLRVNHYKDALRALIKNKIPQNCLLVVDDAHLLDWPSLDLFSELIGNCFLLIICRTEDTPADHPLRCFFDERINQTSSLHLSRLSPADVEHLLAHLESRQTAILANHLYSITQGNPLFLIATLQHLFEQGVLFVNAQGEWEQSGPIDSTVSPSIQQTITARLQTLQPENRRILDMLAVAGGSSSYELLRSALKAEESVLLTHVDCLIESGFMVEPRDAVSAEVEIAHACYQEVVYQTLPSARRRIYHRQIGEAMLAIGMDSPFDAAVLAHHFRHGEIKEKAVQYAKIGGDYALRVYAPKQALKHFQDALDWLELPDGGEPTEPVAQIWMGMAEALRLSGAYEQALTYYQKAMPYLQDEVKQAAAYQAFQLQIRQGMPLSVYEDWAAAHEQEIAAAGDSWALALFFWARSFVALLRGNQKEMIVHNAMGWRVSRRLMALGLEPPYWVHQRALSIFTRAHNQWSNYPTSIHFANRLLQLTGNHDRGEDANTLAVAKASMGESYYNLGEYQRAQELYLDSLELGVNASDPRLQGDALIGLGWIDYERGNLDSAESYASQVLGRIDQKNDIPRLVNAYILKAQIAVANRSIQDILPALENFVQLARFQEAALYTARILLLLTEANLLIDQTDQAESFAREAEELTSNCRLKRFHCAALRLWAEVKNQQNHREEGFSPAHRAVDLAKKIQTPYEIGLSLRTRGKFQNDPEKSVQDIETALAVFEKIGAEVEVRRTRAILIRLMPHNQV